MSDCERKAIKILDPDSRRIGAYATVWGELDCESDRMTRKAIEPYIGRGTPLMFWLHGLDQSFGSDLVGVWDESAFKADDTGLWVEGNVGADEVGSRAWSLIDTAGSFGLSVGSLWYLVKKEVLSDGSKDILDWPLLEISIMEGGRQCVPSARQTLKLGLQDTARKMGVSFKGRRLIALLESAIERRDEPREEVVRDMAEAAGIDAGTVNQILNNEINRPPPERLRGFSRVLPGVTFEQLERAAAADVGEGRNDNNGVGRSRPGLSSKEVFLMEQQTDQVDVQSLVAEGVRAALAAERAEAEAQAKREAEIQAKATKMASEIAVTELKKFEEEKARLLADQEKMKADHEAALAEAKSISQPQAPVTPSSTEAGLSQPNFLVVYSPYDRLSVFDLTLRYELMRSWGRQPSTKMWRALATRVADMAREEDTLYIKNGRPVKVPAIDIDVIKPRHLLEIDDLEGGFETKVDDRFHNGGFDQASDVVTPSGLKQFMEIAVKANELIYSTQASAGDEWVPTLMTADLWRTIRLETIVLPLFTQFDMPSQPYDYPIESTDPTFYKVGETTDESQLVLTGGPFTDSTIGTGKVTFTAGKLGALSYWSEEMEEDSIIAAEPQFRDQYGLAFAHNIDEILISGDETTGTSNISNDGGSIGAASRYLTIDGLRHQPLVTTTADGRDAGTLTIDDFGATQALMGVGGKWGTNPADLAFLLDTAVWHKAKLLSEVLTLDHFGPAATVLTGQLGSLFGSPLLISEDYGLTDSAGKISSTAANNTLGSFMSINRRGVMVGWRRRPRVRVVGLPGAEARYIVGSSRLDIGFKEAGMVAMSYNITV